MGPSVSSLLGREEEPPKRRLVQKDGGGKLALPWLKTSGVLEILLSLKQYYISFLDIRAIH